MQKLCNLLWFPKRRLCLPPPVGRCCAHPACCSIAQHAVTGLSVFSALCNLKYPTVVLVYRSPVHAAAFGRSQSEVSTFCSPVPPLHRYPGDTPGAGVRPVQPRRPLPATRRAAPPPRLLPRSALHGALRNEGSAGAGRRSRFLHLPAPQRKWRALPAVPHSRAAVLPASLPFAFSPERYGVVSPRSRLGNGSPRRRPRSQRRACPGHQTERAWTWRATPALSEDRFLGREKILHKITPYGLVFLFDVCASLGSRQVTVSTAYSSMAGEAEPRLKSRREPWQLPPRRAPCSALRPRDEGSAVRDRERDGCCG